MILTWCHPELVEATGDEMICLVNRGGRICIFYAACGKIIAAATDVPTEDPEAVGDKAEVDYILEAMRLAFPSMRVDRSQVVFRFCGVRPLPPGDANLVCRRSPLHRGKETALIGVEV